MKIFLFLALLISFQSCGTRIYMNGWDYNQSFTKIDSSNNLDLYLKWDNSIERPLYLPLKMIFYKNGVNASINIGVDNWPFNKYDTLNPGSNIGRFFVKGDTIKVQTLLLGGAYHDFRSVAKYDFVLKNGKYYIVNYWVNFIWPDKKLTRVFEGKDSIDSFSYTILPLDSLPRAKSWYFDGDWGKQNDTYSRF